MINKDAFDIKKTTNTGFVCFKEFFIRYNLLKKCIRLENNIPIPTALPLEGLNTLWDIYYNNQNNEICEKSMQFLVEIYTGLWKNNMKIYLLPTVTDHFIVSSFKALNKLADYAHIEKILKITLIFISQYFFFSPHA